MSLFKIILTLKTDNVAVVGYSVEEISDDSYESEEAVKDFAVPMTGAFPVQENPYLHSSGGGVKENPLLSSGSTCECIEHKTEIDVVIEEPTTEESTIMRDPVDLTPTTRFKCPDPCTQDYTCQFDCLDRAVVKPTEPIPGYALRSFPSAPVCTVDYLLQGDPDYTIPDDRDSVKGLVDQYLRKNWKFDPERGFVRSFPGVKDPK